MKDQYGNLVPKDLVVLDRDWLQLLTATEARVIDGLRWYEKVAPKQLFRHSPPLVSWAEIQKALPSLVVDAYSLTDLGVDFQGEFHYIDHVLHRYNTTDGWYHA